MQTPVYLDYAATTPVDPRVAAKMAACLTMDGNFGNPASRSHMYGWRAEEAVEAARRQVADLIGADPREIVWTSGATEADNLAIKGIAEGQRERGRHIVTSAIEHKAVLDSCAWLARQGFDITCLPPGAGGLLEPAAVAAALRPDTILVSLMHANNEIGTLTDIGAIGRLCRERGIVFHVDAAQTAGKIPIDVRAMNVDLMSLSGHKLYGPKGVGVLYVRRQPPLRLAPQMHGGGHERGLRSGTLATHQAVGMGEACRIAREEMAGEAERIRALRDRLWDGLQGLGAVYLNGDRVQRLPGHLNVSFGYVEGESLLMALTELAVSTGSACTSASLEPSYVLRALGVPDDLAHSALRFSVGRFTTTEEIEFAISRVTHAVGKLRELSPAWQTLLRERGEERARG